MKPTDRRAAEYRAKAKQAQERADKARTAAEREEALLAQKTYEALEMLEDER